MKLHSETLCIQAGYSPKNGEPRQIPIIQSTTFRYETADAMAKLFDLEDSGYFYSRLANPTCDAVAAKIAALEGGSAAMLTGSGQAATFFAIFNIAGNGDHIISSASIYGGSFNLFSVTMKRMGIEFTFIDPDCTEEELNAAFRKVVLCQGRRNFKSGRCRCQAVLSDDRIGVINRSCDGRVKGFHRGYFFGCCRLFRFGRLCFLFFNRPAGQNDAQKKQ